MKKTVGVMLILLMVIMSGCGSNVKINLFIDDELYTSYDSSVMKIINLDIPEKEGMMFVGWEYDGGVAFDTIEVMGDMELHALWEDPIEVFDVVQHVDGPNYIIITGYNGDSIYLDIPAYIDGKLVTELGQLSFYQSQVEIMFLPMDTRIMSTPFVDSEIRKVEFHGSYLMEREELIGKGQYDEILEEYDEVCNIDTVIDPDNAWTFTKGCPIMEVVNVQVSLINDMEHYSYSVYMDLNSYEDDNFGQLGINVFEGATELEEFRFPNATHTFFTDMFSDCYELTSLEVNDENHFYTSDHGILFSKDMTELRLYPAGLDYEEFVLPDSVESIHPQAFNYTEHLSTLIIHKDYNGELNLYGSRSLGEIIIEDGNEKYRSIDGVLFEDDTLIKYPPSKEDHTYSIPDGVTKIARHAFLYNKYLEVLDLNDGLREIGAYAFLETESLTVLDVPGSVVLVGLDALHFSSIETLVLRRDIDTYGDVTQLVMHVRGDQDYEKHKIYIPDNSYSAYSYTDWEYHIGLFEKLSEYE